MTTTDGRGAGAPTTCFVVVSTAVELVTVAAALRSGALDAALPRVLVVTGDESRSDDGSDVRAIAERLGVAEEVVTADRLLKAAGKTDVAPLLLVGDRSLDAGRALARRLDEVPVTLVATGAAVYGPTPHAVRGRLARLTDRVLHADLAPGLEPLLLSERSVTATAVPLDDLRAAAALLPVPAPLPDPTTLVLGHLREWAGVLETEEQEDLLVWMVRRCAEAGHSRIVLLLDPGARPRTRRQLEKAAKESRAELTLVEDAGPVEPWLADPGVRLVVGCATGDLLTAAAVFGRRTAQLGTDVIVKRLEPFSDPRRPAATLVLATVADLRSWTAAPEGEAPPAVDLRALMTAVGYAMEPELLAGRRREAIDFLRGKGEPGKGYVRRRRLSALRLPGGKRRVRKTLD